MVNFTNYKREEIDEIFIIDLGGFKKLKEEITVHTPRYCGPEFLITQIISKFIGGLAYPSFDVYSLGILFLQIFVTPGGYQKVIYEGNDPSEKQYFSKNALNYCLYTENRNIKMKESGDVEYNTQNYLVSHWKDLKKQCPSLISGYESIANKISTKIVENVILDKDFQTLIIDMITLLPERATMSRVISQLSLLEQGKTISSALMTRLNKKYDEKLNNDFKAIENAANALKLDNFHNYKNFHNLREKNNFGNHIKLHI